jgi:hypothetical protein
MLSASRACSGDTGLNAIAEGFRHLGYKDDREVNPTERTVYNALYAYCQERVRQGKPMAL